MTSPALDAEPACPAPAETLSDTPSPRVAAAPALTATRVPFADIPRETWDALAARTPWASPFSDWAFHRSWWDAFGPNAHEQTLVVADAGATNPVEQPLAIVPLMHRHEVEPTDAATHTTMRHGGAADLTRVPDTATAVFFGASYHADYATILSAPADLPAVAKAVVARLEADASGRSTWDVVDLRRLRCGDPAAEALAAAFGQREIGAGWTLNVEREDVCPVATIPDGVDMNGYLDTLGKKERHEIRRKVRRAEAAGEIRLVPSQDPVADLPAFIDLHQKRWGADGLFPPTAGGDQSRVFFRRLFETFGREGPLVLSFLTVGERRIAAGIAFETADSVLYYNAGVDPEARELSPGVLLVARYIDRAISSGRHRIDFLRGDEPYKYEWGALDEPIQRLLIRRTGQ